KREGQAGRDEPERRGKARGVVEPDRDQADDEQEGRPEVERLPQPEAEALVLLAAADPVEHEAERALHEDERDDEDEAEEDLLAVVGIDAHESQAEQLDGALRTDESDPSLHGGSSLLEARGRARRARIRRASINGR